MEDAWENLANAIVIQAAKDYRTALKCVKLNPRNTSAQYDKAELERFFRSGWYAELTKVDGEYLMAKLQEEVNA